MGEDVYDLCIIGGGINGAGIARDAAGRGLSVLLVEADDLASGTSSASTKLIHGGLRYLENYEFAMVRAALKEREILLRAAPHLIYPVEIIIPHQATLRSAWLIRAGLFLYDRLGGKTSLPRSRSVDISVDISKNTLKKQFKNGFSYSDAWGDDSRLVVANAVDAASRGARILTRTECAGLAVLPDGGWSVSLRDVPSGRESSVRASMIVNAAGPWVGKFLAQAGLDVSDAPKLRLVKGSHIIVPRLYEGEHIFLLQQADRRIVFVIPYEGKYTLIGTTEQAYDGDPREAMIAPEETEYLCAAYNAAFEKPITKADVVFTYSGVRPLLDDGADNNSRVTRDYKIHHHDRFRPALLSVYGGKLTTYRVLSEAVVNKLMALSGRTGLAWSSSEVLPGGDMAYADFSIFLQSRRERYPWLPMEMLRRYAHAYGTRMDDILEGKSSLSGLGRHFGEDVYDAEIAYLIAQEWARSAEDVLWRRSKLGLHVSDKTVDNLEDYFSNLAHSKTAS